MSRDDRFTGLPTEEASEVDGRSRTDRERTRLYFRLSALLFLGGGIAAIPPNLLLLSEESAVIFVLPVLGSRARSSPGRSPTPRPGPGCTEWR